MEKRYVPALLPRMTWQIERRNVRVDDVVVVADSNAIRGKWNVVRALEVYPGSNDRVRNVKVKTRVG